MANKTGAPKPLASWHRFTFGEQLLFRLGKDIAGPVAIRGYKVMWVGDETRVLTQIRSSNT